jgi:CheY-like chemotaxis protein
MRTHSWVIDYIEAGSGPCMLELARKAEFRLAVLDLNLNGTLSYPIAEVIRERGIPVIFATGYGADGVLDRFRDCPTLQKPFSQQDFAEAVAAACRKSLWFVSY